MNMRTLHRPLLEVERLEARDVPASITFPDANGVIRVIANDENNAVRVRYDSTGTKVVIETDWAIFTTAASEVTGVVVYGLGGSDWLTNTTAKQFIAFGGNGNDLLIGGSGNDYLYGGSGNDNLIGGLGDDHLYGMTGADILRGQDGNDILDGGDDGEVDQLWGGSGVDEFFAELFRDELKDHHLGVELIHWSW
jgi:Ca2+-binding RTX toxin-like protein